MAAMVAFALYRLQEPKAAPPALARPPVLVAWCERHGPMAVELSVDRAELPEQCCEGSALRILRYVHRE